MTQPIQNVQVLPISSLQPNPLQPRGTVREEELAELVSSIKQHGLLEPIVVAHTPAGFQIIAGERRWLASKRAGLTEVHCVVKETTPKGMLEMAIIENVQRVDLHPMERANAFQKLLTDFRLTVGQVADRIGKSQAYVSNTLRLLTLPEAIQDGLLSGAISEGHARALASIEDVKYMVEAYKIILKESGSVRRAEELSRIMKAKMGKPLSKGFGRAPFMISEEITAWQNRMQDYFGRRSQVKLQQSRTQTKVQFVFKGAPEETQRYLEKIAELVSEPLSEEEPQPERMTLESFTSTEIVIGEEAVISTSQSNL